jgi:fermentation-respiration switch protein FrsA (DUF1100 family)
MINILDDVAPTPENGNNDSQRWNGEEVSFRAVDGHRLEGTILSHRDADSLPLGMVVFAHEFGTDRASCLRYCRPLLDAGYDVFSFDFRGHGASAPEEGYRPRQWPSDRERDDMLGAIAFLSSYLEQQDRPCDIGVFGISRGGGAAILAAAAVENVRAIVTDGAFSSDTTLEYLMRRFATIFARIRIVAENHPPIVWRFLRWLLFRECARRFNCRFPSVRKAVVRMGPKPILLIHGEKDSTIPIAQSQALYDLALGPKSLWIVPGASHNHGVVVAPKLYADRILCFFDEYLAVRRRSPRPIPIRPSRREKLLAVEASPSSAFEPALVGAHAEPATTRV